MMLFKLALKNIRKSIKDYTIYFFTLILGISIFYIFNAMESQTVLLNVSSSGREIIKLMNSFLSGVSVFVSLVLGFLIIYASNFLIKRRKKEFGIYMTLGMSKREISKILVFEMLFVGIFSLIIGGVLGVFLSQLMSVWVAKMFETDMTEFTFIFSQSALIKTILYFGIMYVIVLLFNTISVSRCKLIQLLQAGKKTEQIKIKNKIVSFLIFVVAVSMLGYAYYLVTFNIDQLSTQKLLIAIGLGCVGTFFLFWSLSGILLRLVQKNRSVYYRDLNSFVLRQMNSKINTTVFSMTVISILLFLTICILSSGLSIKDSMTKNLKTIVPMEFQAEKPYHPKEGIQYTPEQLENMKKSTKEILDNLGFGGSFFKDVIEVNTYIDPSFTTRVALGTVVNRVMKEYPMARMDTPETIMKLSDYNRLAKAYHFDTYSLEDDEYFIIGNYKAILKYRDMALKENQKITINGKNYNPKFDTVQDGFLDMNGNPSNIGIFIVPDHAVTEQMLESNYIMANYNVQDDNQKREYEERIQQSNLVKYNRYTVNAVTKTIIYEASNGLGAMATFIGIYLGLIFLITSAAILALKELSESSDNKERYQMLRNIGVDEKMINRALWRQISLFFLFPLFVAIIHSVVGIHFSNQILISIGIENMLPSIAMTSTFFLIIYGGYFIITYFSSKSMIRENERR